MGCSMYCNRRSAAGEPWPIRARNSITYSTLPHFSLKSAEYRQSGQPRAAWASAATRSIDNTR